MAGHGGDGSPIIALIGPTAVGKTAVALQVARSIDAEIISADSMAVYRGMDIGTAKPADDERRLSTFHLIDVCDVDESFSVAAYREQALTALSGIRARGKRAVLSGGTGLYVRVLLEGYSLTASAGDPVIRAELEDEALRNGVAALYERLTELDPAAAGRIHRNDRIRIIRALEVIRATGRRISEEHSRDAVSRKRLPSVKFGLTAAREIMYKRIDDRVDAMICAGLKEEVLRLLAHGYGPGLHPLRSLGYKEMIAHIQGEYSLDDAGRMIKQNTRRFAKRQMTWFRAEPDVEWIDVGERTAAEVAYDIERRMPS